MCVCVCVCVCVCEERERGGGGGREGEEGRRKGKKKDRHKIFSRIAVTFLRESSELHSCKRAAGNTSSECRVLISLPLGNITINCIRL